MGCWISGFYCILDALSLWTSELFKRLKMLSIVVLVDTAFVEKLRESTVDFVYFMDAHSKVALKCLKHKRELKFIP